jgi:hypothetical protein
VFNNVISIGICIAFEILRYYAFYIKRHPLARGQNFSNKAKICESMVIKCCGYIRQPLWNCIQSQSATEVTTGRDVPYLFGDLVMSKDTVPRFNSARFISCEAHWRERSTRTSLEPKKMFPRRLQLFLSILTKHSSICNIASSYVPQGRAL